MDKIGQIERRQNGKHLFEKMEKPQKRKIQKKLENIYNIEKAEKLDKLKMDKIESKIFEKIKINSISIVQKMDF